MNTRASNGLPYWTASIAVPGWGQMCQGRVIYGLVALWTIATLYWLAWPVALVLHIINIIDAAVFAHRRQGGP